MTRPRKATEADFTTFCIDLAHALGWRAAHFRAARTDRGWRTPVSGDGAGFPDLVLVRPPRLIFAELKSDVGRLRDEQKQWLAELGAVAIEISTPVVNLDFVKIHQGQAGGVEVYVWRPRDLETIKDVLAR